MKDALDVFALCIYLFEGIAMSSRATRNNNPGNLRPRTENDPNDGQGYCKFHNLMDGWSALRGELISKFTGHNEHNIGPESTILLLMDVYAPSGDQNDPKEYAAFIAKRLSIYLARKITPDTTLGEIWQPQENKLAPVQPAN